jgi:hypothetical protein
MTAATRKRQVTRADLLPMPQYAAERRARRAALLAVKQDRRIEVGPFAMFHFESFETMWHQIHEMLLIEKGGEAQIDDELAAYNPLIPQGHELVATVMFEVTDAEQRAAVLARLGGVENTAFLRLAGETLRGRPEQDQERSTAEGKASAVQFIHFPFTKAQIAAFRQPGAEVILGFDHPHYGHMAVMTEAMRQLLAADFD